MIGHRGSGADPAAGISRLQIGENTVLSFVTAASLGAEYVEFGNIYDSEVVNASLKSFLPFACVDVQLTRDSVPVIYHDWVIGEAAAAVDINVNQVSLDQFRSLRKLKEDDYSPDEKRRGRSSSRDSKMSSASHRHRRSSSFSELMKVDSDWASDIDSGVLQSSPATILAKKPNGDAAVTPSVSSAPSQQPPWAGFGKVKSSMLGKVILAPFPTLAETFQVIEISGDFRQKY